MNTEIEEKKVVENSTGNTQKSNYLQGKLFFLAILHGPIEICVSNKNLFSANFRSKKEFWDLKSISQLNNTVGLINRFPRKI